MLDCLQIRIDRIKEEECRKEIFLISEFQGENFKLDNSLLQACKDQSKRCSDLERKNDFLVYKCLQESMNDIYFSRKVRIRLF